jgi:hypothetical protein
MKKFRNLSSRGAAGPDLIGMVISWPICDREVDPDGIGMTLEFIICLAFGYWNLEFIHYIGFYFNIIILIVLISL